jgi:hypothetical protein
MGQKILIVGSGPSGLSSINVLSKLKNYEITLIDNSNFQLKEKSADCYFKNTFDLGNRITNDEVIFDNQYSNYYQNDLPDISKSFGGFSNVWGGTISQMNEKDSLIYHELGINLHEDYKEIYRLINTTTKKISEDIPNFLKNKFINNTMERINNLENKKIKANFSNIALKNDLIVDELAEQQICKFCKSYKWYCSNSPIWSSKDQMRKIIKLKNIKYQENTRLIKFTEEKDDVKCLLTKNNESYLEDFSKVVLASGPIATSTIMINSGIVDKAELQNTDLYSIPFVKIFNFEINKTSFADLFINFRSNEKDFFIQLYNFSRGLMYLGKDAVSIVKYVNKLPDFCFSFLGGLFIYIDSQFSSKLLVRLNQNTQKIEFERVNSRFQQEVNFQLKKLSRLLLFVGVKPLKILTKKYLFGTSNHYGAQFPHSKYKNGDTSDLEGRVNNIRNVHIVDSSVLPRIHSGPLTLTTMANSNRISKLITSELTE